MGNIENKVEIIAEAGVNHNGDFNIAKKMIDVASEAGADTVKFQVSIPSLGLSRFAEKADYAKNTTGNDESFLDMCKKLHLPLSSYAKLKEYCIKKKIKFLATPFDSVSIELLDKLGEKRFKIPSGEITDTAYLRKIGSYNYDIILSTGMSSLDEISWAISTLEKAGQSKTKITVLHCNTEYPTPYEDVNLKAMITIKDKLKVKVGYSDHTLGIVVPIASAAMGASIIEKHFTLDKNMPGPDQAASLEPNELKMMVDEIRNIEKILGDGIKKPSDSESKNIKIARKSIVAKIDIKKGEILSDSNITAKRPGTGISAVHWDKIIGKKSKKDYKEDELIQE